MKRRLRFRPKSGAQLSEIGFRFVPNLNETRMRGRARVVRLRRCARLNDLQRQLLGRLALDRERTSQRPR